MTKPLFLVDSSSDNAPINTEGLQLGWVLTLPDSVKRHAIQSMRLHNGDELQLADGKGLRINATIVDDHAGTVRVESFTKETAPHIRLVLVQALAKNGHDEQAIDVATQIGVDDVIPWQSDRSIARFKAGRTDKKWQQTLQASTEQSRRAFIPQLHSYLTSKQLVTQCQKAVQQGDLVIVLHQDATLHWSEIEQRVQALTTHTNQEASMPHSIYVVVGPEGGISEQEIEMLKEAGAEVCLLGTNILRASAAGPVALSLLSRSVGRFA